MGGTWLDFLVTHIGRYTDSPVDLLADPAAAREWFARYAMEPTVSISADDLDAMRTVREALHHAAVAAIHNEQPATPDTRVIAAALSADRPLRVRRTAGALATVRPASAAEATARLARQAAEDLAGPQRRLLRACDDVDCSGIFLDHTGRRRWCADERCGVKARVRAHRARARAAHA